MDVEKIIKFIQKQAGSKPVIIGLSGGIDSTVCAYLATQALGKEKVYGLIMPSISNSSQDLKFAELVANLLEIERETIDIENIIKSFQQSCDFYNNKLSLGNLKARIRMSLLYGIANQSNSIVMGTGNKTEIMVGYYTKYGDGGVDLLPLGNLYKTQVLELAKQLNVPDGIIKKKPSGGLWENQYDEDELKISYKKLDAILDALDKKKGIKKINKHDVDLVKKYIQNSEHKRNMPPICKL